MKINKLTKEQERLVPDYLDKWLKVGRRTETIDREKAKAAIDFLYTDIMQMAKPKHYFFVDSPMACQITLGLIGDLTGKKHSQLRSQLGSQLNNQLRSQLDSQLDSQLYSQLYSQLGSQLDSQLRSQLDSQLDSQLRSQLYSQLRSQLYSQLDSQLRSQLYSQLYSQLDSQLRSQLDSQLYSQLDSQLYSQLGSQLGSQLRSQLNYVSESRSNWFNSYYYFYDFILSELLPKKKNDFKLFTDFLNGSKEYHHIYLSSEVAVFSDFPEQIHVNKEGKLDFDKGMALKYRDGYGIYAIEGERIDAKSPVELALAGIIVE